MSIENQTQIAINWTHKMEEVIRTLTGKANKIKKKFRHRNINKAIKKINKSYKKGERNFWAKVSNRTQKEEPITSVALLNNKISNKFEKIIEGFTQLWEKLYSGHIQKPDNLWQEWYSRENLKDKKTKPTEPFTIKEVKDMIKQMVNTSPVMAAQPKCSSHYHQNV